MSGDQANVLLQVLDRLTANAARGRSAALGELAQALFSVVSSDASLADHALTVLAESGPQVWIDLDASLRPSWYEPQDFRRRRRQAKQAIHGRARPLGVALAACWHDGHVREKALTLPATRADIRLYPVLVIRTTDWVEAVRVQAERVLREVLATPDTRTLLAILPVAVRLGDRRRGGHIVGLVRDALLRVDDAVLASVRGLGDLRGRRFAFQVSIEGGRMDERQLAHAALHERDLISRTRSARALAAQAVARQEPQMLEELLRGSSGRVRVEALTAMVQLGHTEAGPRFLADKESMVRLTAQWAVRRSGGDPAVLYRGQLAARPRREARVLLAGLGDCGIPADAGLALPYLADPRPRIRAEAVHALCRIGASFDFATLLDDPAPVVVRRAVKALRRTGTVVPADRLWRLLGGERPRHVRLAAHRLLIGHDPWTRLKADLAFITDPDEEVRGRARADIATWTSRHAATMYVSPPEWLRAELQDLIARGEPELGPKTAHLLRWLVRGPDARPPRMS
ncbi:HEAT repeat domain-containing protein [Planotetraspora sp. GP83]|uniref:HEAT repeat domain-containing protein n=1 Tax=Planotetraspora sp. GP83 TaxID=3156264 RepID=UPI0035120BFE